MENKDLLLSLLNLTQALKDKNQTNIDAAIEVLNQQTNTEENVNFIKDFIKNTQERSRIVAMSFCEPRS